MKKIVFSVVLCVGLFMSVFQANGQSSFNVHALEDLKKSIESLIVGDYDNAIFYSSNVIKREPASSVAYTVRARAYFEKGDMTNTIADCTQAISHDRNNASAYSIRADAYVRNGNMNRAVSDWRSVLKISPENTVAQHNIELATGAQ